MIPARILVSINTAKVLGLVPLPSKFPGCVEVDYSEAKIAAMKSKSNVDSRLGKQEEKKKADFSKAHHKTWDQKIEKEANFEEET